MSSAALRQRARHVLMRPGSRRVPWGLAAGLRFEVDPKAPVHIYLGTAEVEIASHLRRLAKPGAPCFDIGSHNAYYALVLARLSGAAVATFDFDPEALSRIERNLALNPELAEQVTVHSVYLSYETNVAVNADTLDAVVAREHLAPPALVKIDVEGGEANVLRGAAQLLQSRPHLVIETHGPDVERECADILTPLGYRLTVVTQRRRFREHRPADNRWLIAEAPT